MKKQEPLRFRGALSAELRTLIGRERAAIEQVSGRTVEMILESVADYTQSGDRGVVDDMARSARMNAELWFAALLDGVALTPETLEPVVSFARRRVHQGVSMTGLLRAYRIIVRAFWIRMLENAGDDQALQAELAMQVSPYLLEHFDCVAEAIAANYLQEQSQHARWRERLRQELWSIVRSRPEDVDGFQQLTKALGLAPEQAHCAVAFRLTQEASAWPERHIDAPVLALARRLKQTGEALMRALHQDHLVVWVPQSPESPAILFEQDLADKLSCLMGSLASVASVGIGLPGIAARGWKASLEQALRALREPRFASADGKVCRYARIMIDDSIRSESNIADFARSIIDPLQGQGALIDTLCSYLEQGMHRQQTAAALAIHPNTLDRRLARIETLLGGRFTDVEWLQRVHAGLRAQQYTASNT